ncbi:hypothetical protein L1887_04434 [Cichorium endivia]|nr:hypothetical protein L1887_04434 [Cichorium endivia]
MPSNRCRNRCETKMVAKPNSFIQQPSQLMCSDQACKLYIAMASLDMSLDDMIKSRRTSERGRGRGRGRRGHGGQGGRPTTTGPPRKGPLRVNARPSAYTIAKASPTIMDILCI